MPVRGDTSAHQPARLPATEADLAAWSVYADHLMTLGDPRGEAMALELALPAEVPRVALARWHALAKPRYGRGGATPIGWCLGHARTLAIACARPAQGHRYVGPTVGALAHAADVLARPQGRLVEELAIEYAAGEHGAAWRRLFAALPRTCRRVVLGMPPGAHTAEIAELVALLPAHVRELALARRLGPQGSNTLVPVTARFDLVDLSHAFLEPRQLAALRTRLEVTPGVSVRVANLGPALLGAPRCTLGAPGDAAVVDVAARQASALPRWTLVELQARYGHVPVRTQLAGNLGEGYALLRTPLGFITGLGSTVLRWGGRWTLAGHHGARLDGRALGDTEIVDVPDGAWITVMDSALLLFTTDADARSRDRIGQRAF